MKYAITGRAKKNTIITLIILIAAMYCCSVDLSSYDCLGSGGSIKATGCTASPSSVISCVPSAIQNHINRNNEPGDDLSRNVSSSILHRSLMRRFFQSHESGQLSGTVSLFHHFFISLCIAGSAFLRPGVQIRYMHLQDGSK